MMPVFFICKPQQINAHLSYQAFGFIEEYPAWQEHKLAGGHKPCLVAACLSTIKL
jgi:hypothetical protein